MASLMEFVRVPQIADDVLQMAVPGNEMPTYDVTMRMIDEHVENTSTTKYGNEKAALFPTAAQIAGVREYLEKVNREGTAEGTSDTSQWRFGMKRKYELDESGMVCAMGIKGGYVVPREQIHNVLVWAHTQTGHGGRDRMYNLIKSHYCESSFPKAFVGEWSVHCGYEKCLKKPRGVTKGKTPAAKTTVKAQKQVNGAPKVWQPRTPDVAPEPSLVQAEPDEDTISSWDDMPTADIGDYQLPMSIRDLFTTAELEGFPEVVEVAPTAAAAEAGAMGTDEPTMEPVSDLDFNVDQYMDFSDEVADFGADLDF
ncbi:hypothetical protein MMC18_004341 [Xylographa bjoerkii]|nr:hypothetical protein [Xylographa bjoerkii]